MELFLFHLMPLDVVSGRFHKSVIFFGIFLNQILR